MKSRVVVLILALLWFPCAVFAIRVPGLYEAEVPVEDQGEKHSDRAVRTAMRAVLIKVTGDRHAPQRTSLQPVIESADDYVQQYRYVRTPDPVGTGEAETESLKLRVIFDEQTLNKALRSIGVPIWSKERPVTLVWLAVQDGTERHIVSLEKDFEYIRILDNRARMRGIVLMFPIMDLQERRNIRISDIWGGFSQPILEASRRYQADAVLVGKITSPVPGIWEAEWTGHIDGTSTHWTAEGVLPDVVLDEGVDGQADRLAAQFAGSGASMQITQLSIEVREVSTADDYARVLKYLRSLSSVTDVQVKQVEPGRVHFAVTAHGGGETIRQAIALGRFIEPVEENIEGEAGFSYRLAP